MNLEFGDNKLVVGTDNVLFQYQLVNIHSFLSYLKHYPYIFIYSWFRSGILYPTKLFANLCISTTQLFCFFLSFFPLWTVFFSQFQCHLLPVACLYYRFLDHRINFPRVSGLYWPIRSFLLFSQEGEA